MTSMGEAMDQAVKSDTGGEGALARVALGFTNWAERWFPDAFVFVALAVVIVALAALLNGATPEAIVKSFGDGYWSLIKFTMQMALMIIAGYVVANSPPVERFIDWLASFPKTGRGAVAWAAAMCMIASLLSWAMSMIFGGLLVRALARRKDLGMDYRAAGAAAYLGLGSVWALGLSSSAALLQSNQASLSKDLLAITGIIPLTQTIFLWQSGTLLVVLFVLSIVIAYWSAPLPAHAVTAQALGVDVARAKNDLPQQTQPGEWLEYSPVLTIALAGLGLGWAYLEFTKPNQTFAAVMSSIDTYNLLFLTAALLLQWQPKRFLRAVQNSLPATGGILIQFPLYAAIAAILTNAKNAAGLSVSDQLAHLFVSLTTHDTFPIAAGIYSAVLGLFVPSGGGKWLLEAPYVMKAANELKVHLGWVVQTYNAAEALPNLINPFFMLPLLGVVGLKARDIVGFTFMQFLIHTPVVLFLLWLLAGTLTYVPPVIPVAP